MKKVFLLIVAMVLGLRAASSIAGAISAHELGPPAIIGWPFGPMT